MKTHVALEQHMCEACGAKFETGNVLLDTRLKASMERFECTGWGLCKTCLGVIDQGYVILIGIDPTKSIMFSDDMKFVYQHEVYRTGCIMEVRREVFKDLLQDKEIATTDNVFFVEQKVLDNLFKNSQDVGQLH